MTTDREKIDRALSSAPTLKEFQEKIFPEKDFIIEPLIRVGQIIFVCSAAGIGKTWLSIALAVGATKAGPLFGPFQTTTPVGVVYIDGEMSSKEMQERFEILQIDYDPENLKIISADHFSEEEFPTPNINNKDWRDAFIDFFKKNPKYKMLVVDNLSCLAPGLDENKKQDWDPINQFNIALKRLGVTVVLVHHTGKSGDQRGTSSHLDSADTYLYLEKISDDSGTGFQVIFKKARSLRSDEKEPFILKLNEDTAGKLDFEYKRISENRILKVAQYISMGRKQTEIANEFGINQATISRDVKKAKTDGYLNDKNELTQKAKKEMCCFNLSQ